jgi:hypothetical protein
MFVANEIDNNKPKVIINEEKKEVVGTSMNYCLHGTTWVFVYQNLVILNIDRKLDLEGKLVIQGLPRMHPLYNGRLIIAPLNPITT